MRTLEILEDFRKKKLEWLLDFLMVKKRALCLLQIFSDQREKPLKTPSLFSSKQAALHSHTEDLCSSKRQGGTVPATNYGNVIS